MASSVTLIIVNGQVPNNPSPPASPVFVLAVPPIVGWTTVMSGGPVGSQVMIIVSQSRSSRIIVGQ